MKQKTFLALLILTNLTVGMAQSTPDLYKGKTYIFDYFASITPCSNMGDARDTGSAQSTTAPKGALFTVQHIMENGDLVIVFNEWNLPKNSSRKNYAVALSNRTNYNFKTDPAAGKRSMNSQGDNVAFFLLEIKTMQSSCSEYIREKRWDITLGTLSTPFRIRSNPYQFTTNLNLGTAVCYQHKLWSDFSWGVIGGLSLSSVTLDAYSTNDTVKENSERPAFTPSIHGMIGYKAINLTLGMGWDFINLTSNAEKSWSYQCDKWFGVGIGISLFNTSGGNANAAKPAGQKEH